MCANITKQSSFYLVTVNGISLRFSHLVNAMKYCKMLNFTVVHSHN